MAVSLIFTLALAIVILGITAGLTARYRSFRALGIGLGLTAFPVGLYLTGLTDLTINGVRSLIDWFQRTPFTNVTAWGIGLSIGGVALFVIGLFLPKGHKPEPHVVTSKVEGPGRTGQGKAALGPQPSVSAGRPGASSAPAPTAPAGKAAPQQKGLDPEDAEIEAMLRKRGIM